MCYAKPGPRCSRHAADALKAAYASGDKDAIKDAKRDFALTPRGIAALKAKGETQAADWCQRRRNQMVAAYTATLEFNDLNKELRNRLSSEEFNELLTERDAARDNYERLDKDLEALKRNDDSTFEQVKAKTAEVKEAYFAQLDAKANLDEYKNETAHLVARISDTGMLDSEEYTSDRLGNAVAMESYISNSREWLKQRQNGIGGSDVGAILKVDPKWGRMNHDRCLDEKTTDFDAMADDEFHPTELNNNRSVDNAMQRGDAWEPVIANMFAAQNPQFKVMHTKMTWQNEEDPEMMANIDGLLSSREDGQPDGILEIKTSANKADWENGVPPGYRAQALHYLEVTGLDYAYVAVQLDDKEYRQYRIERGEKITERAGTVADNKGKLKDFLAKSKRIRSGEEPRSSSSGRSSHPLITFSEGSQAPDKLLAAYSGRSVEEVRQSLRNRGSAVDYDAAVRAEFAEMKMGDNDKVVIDLETTGFKASTSEIIELAWTRRNNKNEVVSQGSMMFTPDPRFLRTRGTGRSDVHGIEPSDVAGKPHFSDPDSQRKIMEAFEGATIVAHHADFERSFLNQNLEGFKEKDYPVIDTMLLSKFFDTESERNTLESFATRHGVPYENAHQALDDSKMTADALFNFARKHNHVQ